MELMTILTLIMDAMGSIGKDNPSLLIGNGLAGTDLIAQLIAAGDGSHGSDFLA